MTHINLLRNVATLTTSKLYSPGSNHDYETLAGKSGILIFAGLLIACSFAVGCSNDKSKPSNSNASPQIAQSAPPAAVTASAPAPVTEAPAKPVHKRVVHKAPVTVNYEDGTSGLSFHYPRKYALKTGENAEEVASSSAAPMNFVQPGGARMAAVIIPATAYPKSDLISAIFDVSVNKTITAEQCAQFSTVQTSSQKNTDPSSEPVPKPLLGDLELQSAESESNTGARKETTKYYHVFENGGCFEFALDVATTGMEPDEGGKAIDRDEVFNRLEKILNTVKISPIEQSSQTAGTSATAATAPAQ